MDCNHDIVGLDNRCQDCGKAFDAFSWTEVPQPSIIERAWGPED